MERLPFPQYGSQREAIYDPGHGFVPMTYEDYVAGKGESGAREVGKLRIEGKEYLVKDGDVLLFRFNV